jgi:riboflavin kinase/FMN adenylyltransferase
MAMDKKHVIALGFFDGVHLGHRALMEKTLEIAEKYDYIPSVITFDAHPMSRVTGKNVPLINSPEERASLIRRLFGISDVIFLHFDDEMVHMPWEEFTDRLVEDFNAGYLVCGHDHKFGYKGIGTADKLKEHCKKIGIGCSVVPAVTVNGERISSTLIRKLISDGDMEEAVKLLGHPHVLTDIVRSGRKLGRTIDFPTVNMEFGSNVLVPRHGVYAAIATLEDGSRWHGVTNVGVRPTVDNSGRVTAETFIVGYSGNLYGRTVRIEFYRFERPEMKFKDINELKARITLDAENIKAYFKNMGM